MSDVASEDESTRLRRFLQPSIDVAGGVTAAGISFLVGDPTGILAAVRTADCGRGASVEARLNSCTVVSVIGNEDDLAQSRCSPRSGFIN